MMTSAALKLVEDPATDATETLDPEAVFLQVTRDCCQALMEGCGVALRLESEDREVVPHIQHAGYAGLIGFGGTEMRGSLVIYLDESVVVSTRPQTLGRVENQDAALRDWTGELANQLLGRMKNAMLRYEVKIGMGVPTAISGNGYTLTAIGDTSPVRMCFSSPVGTISVLVNVRCRPGLHLTPPSSDSEDAAAEGDMMLF